MVLTDLVHSVRGKRLSWLAARSKRGDREAFRDLYRALYPAVWTFVRRRIDQAHEVDDLVSEVFKKFLERLSSVDPKKNVLAYALAIARTTLIDRQRALKAAFSLKESPHNGVHVTPVDTVTQREDHEA